MFASGDECRRGRAARDIWQSRWIVTESFVCSSEDFAFRFCVRIVVALQANKRLKVFEVGIFRIALVFTDMA